jgi:hypothetical protein
LNCEKYDFIRIGLDAVAIIDMSIFPRHWFMSRFTVCQTDVRFTKDNQMTKCFPMLLLAAAIGCTQGAAPNSSPDSTTDISTEPGSTEVAMQLPDASATTVEFFCPGMT